MDASCAGRCDDAACTSAPECVASEDSELTCGDNIDNDGDDATDCADPDCAMISFCGDEGPDRCDDMRDNDGDGAVDCEDTDCTGAAPCLEESEAACSDDRDNDGDGDVDCDDDGCAALSICMSVRVRVVAANLTSGNRQTYDPGHGIRIMAGLEGDIFLVQEMNFGDDTAADMERLTDQSCGTECEYYRGGGELIPNGVISRYPILDAGEWDDPETNTREFAWARIDVPGTADLWAISVHLLTSNNREREAEAQALVARAMAEIPAGDHIVVGGDFNTAGGSPFDRLQSIVRTDSVPRDQSGNANTNGPRSRRLDAVFVSGPLDGAEIPVRIGDQQFVDGLVVDTREFTPLEALAPAREEDSGVNGMQHMAVVRDFMLP